MEELPQNQSQSAYPFVLLALLSLIAVFDAHKPLDSLRPPQPEKESVKLTESIDAFEIDQRIWEDPFLNGWFYGDHQANKKILQWNLDTGEDTLLMPVILPGKLIERDREIRRRRRYAVHQALSRAGYRATSPGSIIAQDLSNFNSTSSIRVSTEVFEIDFLSQHWYKEDHENDLFRLRVKGDKLRSVRFFDDSEAFKKFYKTVIVVYVRDMDIDVSPLISIFELTDDIIGKLGFVGEDRDKIDTRILGPVDSGQVYNFLANISELLDDENPNEFLSEKVEWPEKKDNFQWLVQELFLASKRGAPINLSKRLKDFESTPSIFIFSPFATSDWETLIGQIYGTDTSGYIPRIVEEDQFNEDLLVIARDTLEKLTGIRYIRTVHEDSKVFEAILRELKLRDVITTVDDLDKVALIVESDTRYGRSMGVNFLRGAQKVFPQSGDFDYPKNMDMLNIFPYISGLDGYALPSTDIPERNESELEYGSDSPFLSSADWNDPPAHGNHQIDYIRRLADELVKRQSMGKTPIRAIGILGTDVYDKLMMMRALKPLLSEVVYFTTDIDARLWHKSEIEFTRNVIIGSSHGLSFSEDIQNFVSPFRDSYQASLFVSVLLATNTLQHPYQIDYYSPHIFEIGTRGPLYLAGGDFSASENVDGENLFLGEDQLPNYQLRILTTLIFVLFAMYFAVWVAMMAAKKYRDVCPWDEWKKIVRIVISVIGLSIFLFVVSTGNSELEPIGLPNGTSAWYGFFLNLFNTSLAVSFCVYVCLTRKRSAQAALENDIGLKLDGFDSGKSKDFHSFFIVAFILYVILSGFYGWLIKIDAENGTNLLRFYGGVILIVGLLQGLWFYLRYKLFCKSIDEGKFTQLFKMYDLGRIIVFPLLLFIMLTWLWGFFGGHNFLPLRSASFHDFFGFSQLLQMSTMLMLLSLVVHESIWVMVVVQKLSEHTEEVGNVTFDPEGILKEIECNSNQPNKADTYEENIFIATRCVDLISRLTEIPNRYLIFPFITLFIWFLGLHTDFDGWAWSQMQWTIALSLFALCLLPSVIMRISALRFRKQVMNILDERKAKPLLTEPVGSVERAPEDYSKYLQSIRRGAYGRILNQPYVLAILTPMGGIGSIALIKLFLSYLS